jgi:hypothetical protein
VNGYKDVENRSRATRHRGPLLIHASKHSRELEALRDAVARKHKVIVPDDLETGGIIGIVDVVGCTQRPLSGWHESGHFGWILASPRRLAFRECRGSLGFFHDGGGRERRQTRKRAMHESLRTYAWQ